MTPYYQDDACTIWNADCREVLPAVSADVVVSDPPFGIAWGGATWADSPAEYACFMRSWLALTVDCRAHLVWQAMLTAPRWHEWFPSSYRIFAVCRTFIQMRPTSPQWAWDPVVYWGDLPQRKTANRDWFVCKSSDMSTQKFDHPSPRRIDICRYLVSLATETEDVIVDPFMGSGTTLRAAKDCGRRAVGIEISERYCEIAAKRLAQGVLDFAGGEFESRASSELPGAISLFEED